MSTVISEHVFPEKAWAFADPEHFGLNTEARGKVMIIVPDHDLFMVTLGDTAQPQSANFPGKMMRAVNSILPEQGSMT